MRLIQLNSVKSVRQWTAQQKGKVHGFVPTMGALHDGHAHLVRLARQHCDTVSVSIFVNPTQFGPSEDFAKYPRTLDTDIALLQKAGADMVWTPGVTDLYPRGTQATYVTVPGVSDGLEGAVRPHFFRGVATVVTKLLNVTTPQYAFFGQKDVQQCCVVRAMVQDLLINTQIKVCETQREPDGLAMSSRNRYLTSGERQIAPVLYRSMMAAKVLFDRGIRERTELLNAVYEVLATQSGITIDYVSLASPDTLDEVMNIEPGQYAHLSATIRVGGTRLLDNIILGDDQGLIVK
jgi:pantoate--beta-alanine ligase